MTRRTRILAALPLVLLGVVRADMAESKLTMAGSRRMAPLLRELADEYAKNHPNFGVTIQAGGSKHGVEALCSGSTAAALARAITRDEARTIKTATGRYPVGTPIAMDAVMVYVHRDNPVASISIAQAGEIFRGRMTSWTTLNVPLDPVPGHEHGDDCILVHPTEPLIDVHLLDAMSGSGQVMSAVGMNGKAYPSRGLAVHDTCRGVIDAVSRSPLAIGLAGLCPLQGTRAIPISSEDAHEPVEATPETIQQRRYPLAHYLYLYSAGEPTEALRGFLAFVVSGAGQDIVRKSESGWIPLPLGLNQAD